MDIAPSQRAASLDRTLTSTLGSQLAAALRRPEPPSGTAAPQAGQEPGLQDAPEQLLQQFLEHQRQGLKRLRAAGEDAEDLAKQRTEIVRDFAIALHRAEQVLDAALQNLGDYQKLLQRSEAAVDVAQVIGYAHKISYTTFAPPQFAPGVAPLRGFQPPAPQEEHMRAAALRNFAEADLSSFGQPSAPTPEPMQVPAVNLELNPDLANAPAVPAGWPPELPLPPKGWKPGDEIPLPPLGELPPMPAGWKPGQPVSLPPMPPGWKPGDPVVLPPGVAPPAAAGSKEISAVAGTGAPVTSGQPEQSPPAGVIQVAHVELDLNPDLADDDYGDFSDDSLSDSEED